jgi:hypothetical protein
MPAIINELSRVAEYKVNTQNSVALLHIENEQSEKEITKTSTFVIA